MISFAKKEAMFDCGEARARHRREPNEKREWYQIIGESIRSGFAEFIIATRFAYLRLDDVYRNWDQMAAGIANDTKTAGELFEIYCFGAAKRNFISAKWLNAEFMPKYRISIGESLGLNDLYKVQHELFSDLSRVCTTTGSPERIIDSLNKFNARFQRVEQGFVPTPPKIAERMVRMLVDTVTPNTMFIDHCCGRGIFLTSLRKVFGASCQVYGIEKDVGKAYLASAFLEPDSNSRVVDNVYCRDSLGIKSYHKEIIQMTEATVVLSDITGAVPEPSRIVFVGNPPYHDSDNSFGDSPSAIYNRFVDHGLSHGSEVLFVIPARWYGAGRDLSKFRNKMFTGGKVKQIVDFPDSTKLFPTVNIESGVCFLHAMNGHDGDCDFVSPNGDHSRVDLTKYDILIRDTKTMSILDKIIATKSPALSECVMGKRPFGIMSNFKGYVDDGDLKCRARDGIHGINRRDVTGGKSTIPLWKVICSAADGAANKADINGRKKVLSVIEVLPPNYVCSETYIVVSSFDNEVEAKYCAAYLKLRFSRFMLGLRKITQHVLRDRFKWVPKMDFTREWTDQALYEHFKLSAAEQTYIEATIR